MSITGTIIISLLSISALVQEPVVPIIQTDLSTKTGIAPAFFGPNAFPVPEMSDGCVPGVITADIAGDVFTGFLAEGAEDLTYDIYLNLRLPLYKDRVGLGIWFVPQEWYSMDRQVMDARRIIEDDGRRNVSGDVYVTLELALARERRVMPAILLRSVLKTASGDGFGLARYYDAPGYYFDLTFAKSLIRKENSFLTDLRICASTGFLCWQTDNGRQNDAVQYGLMLKASMSAFTFQTQLSGYVGWENYGDRPFTVTARLAGCPAWPVVPYFQYQHGFNDWPFNQYRFGLIVNIRSPKK